MRPRVHANFAMTLDGCMGARGPKPLEISNAADKRRVHAIRADSDAILVGVRTILADDPKLTVKWDLLRRKGKNPLRVVLDPHLRTPRASRVLDNAAPTLFFALPDAPLRRGWQVDRVPASPGGLKLGTVLSRLGDRGVRRLMVEGGPRTLAAFFQAGLVDEATVFVASWALGDARAPRLGERAFDVRKQLSLTHCEVLGDGALLRWVRS